MSCENALHWSYKNVADHIHGNWLNLSLYKEDKVFRKDVSDVVPADDPVLVFCYIFFWQKAVDGHPSDLIPTSLQVPFLASLGGLSGPLWISGPTVLIYWKKHERFSKNIQGFSQSTSQLLAILRWFGKRGVGWLRVESVWRWIGRFDILKSQHGSETRANTTEKMCYLSLTWQWFLF